MALAVPEEVAVLGVDNDEVLCSLSPPPMSSVILNPRRTGWEAATLLARLMQGEKIAPGEHFIPPIGIATRQSTDILAMADPQIAHALRYIRENAHYGLQVSDVVRHGSISRRALELRFQELLGRTPRQEITRVQMNHVKELLIGTQLTIAEIASRAGFEHTEYLSVVFKRETGMTASEYRGRYGAAK
jgi:LacI family transcriptional regulator